MRHTIERSIHSHETVANTASGNPVHRVYFTNGESMLTGRDTFIPVGNWEPKHHWGVHDVPVTVTVENDRIVRIEGKDAMDLYEEVAMREIVTVPAHGLTPGDRRVDGREIVRVRTSPVIGMTTFELADPMALCQVDQDTPITVWRQQ